MTTTPLTLDGDLLTAAIALRDVMAAKTDLDSREKQLKELLRAAIPPGTTCCDPAGIPLIDVRPGSARFNPTKAIEVLPPELLASVSVTIPDAKRARDLLAPALYSACTTQAAPSVVPL
jgi:hypothetical protein